MYHYPKREGVMLCYPFEEKRLDRWGGPVIVQPKLDGVRCRAVWQPTGSWILLSTQLNEIISVPHINAALHEVFPKGGPEFDGELYTHGLSFGEIFSRTSRTVEYHPEASKIEFHIFDLIKEGTPQFLRLNQLRDIKLEESSDSLKEVAWETALGLSQVMDLYQEICSNGYEGIIVRELMAPYVRKRSTMIMKFKPKKSDWYKIVGFQEEISIEGVPKGRLGAFTCSSDEGETFNVGTGFTAKQRAELWEQRGSLKGRWLHVAYQHITPGRGVPRFPVFMEVIEDWEEPKEIGKT